MHPPHRGLWIATDLIAGLIDMQRRNQNSCGRASGLRRLRRSKEAVGRFVPALKWRPAPPQPRREDSAPSSRSPITDSSAICVGGQAGVMQGSVPVRCGRDAVRKSLQTARSDMVSSTMSWAYYARAAAARQALRLSWLLGYRT